MEDNRFKKDSTPYYVFACMKCKNFSYVKTTQKGKKCLRCGRTHQVKNIIGISEEIYGVTAAKNKVIELQHELGLKELGSEPQLRADNDFLITLPDSKKTLSNNEIKDKKNSSIFQNLLHALHDKYKQFPLYMIKLSAIDYEIPQKKLQLLIKEYFNNGFLKKAKNGLYLLQH